MTTYCVSVQLNSRRWLAEIEPRPALEGVPLKVHVDALAEVRERTRRYIWRHVGGAVEQITVELDLNLPTVVQLHLDMADALAQDAATEYEGAIGMLHEAGASADDIQWLLADRWLAAGLIPRVAR